MHSTSIFPCIMTIISNFKYFLCFKYKFFFTNFHIFTISYDSCCAFVNNFIFFFLKLIISIPCSLKDLQNFFMQYLPLYISCLFSMLLKNDIVDIEKLDGIFLNTLDVDKFSGSFLHPSIFSFNHSRSA